MKKGGKTAGQIEKNVSANIKQLTKDRYPRDQAIAIALDIARKAKAKKRR